MAKTALFLTASFAWWTKPYLHCVRLMCLVTRRQPDIDKVVAVMLNGIRIKAA